MSVPLLGFLLSAAAGSATGIGAVPFLFLKKSISQRSINSALGFAAGVMLAASAFSLVVPSMEMGGPWRFIVGFLLGGVAVDLADRFIPHEHFIKGHEGLDSKRLKAIWLFVIAITIHNFPEGVAVGVGAFTPNSYSIALAIGIQNIPEGMAVAASLLNIGYSPIKAFFVALLTGMVEILGGLTGVMVMSISTKVLPYMMSLAAGAMIFVISDEVVVETHTGGNERLSTYFLLTGFALMAVLDLVMG